MIIDYVQGGLTLQDAGRIGAQQEGFTEGGALDGFAYRLGQVLVGNTQLTPALELFVGRLGLRITSAVVLAITGAPRQITLNKTHTLNMNTPYDCRPGDYLEVLPSTAGNISYVGVRGGIEAPRWRGSCSEVAREGVGGLASGPLMVGTQIPLSPFKPAEGQPLAPYPLPACPSHISPSHISLSPHDSSPMPGGRYRFTRTAMPLVLRFIPGLHNGVDGDDLVPALEAGMFNVSSRSNRVAFSLEGTTLAIPQGPVLSEGNCRGAIQIPPDGRPYVLLNDRPTVGGYRKYGAVIAPDCARLAQCPPGKKIILQAIEPSTAKHILWHHQHYEETLFRALAPRNKTCQTNAYRP